MTDVHTPQQRRRNMQAIKGANTKPELKVRRICHRLGYRFRLHCTELPGRPDLVFPRHKIVLFVHGCFWHQHECRYGQVQPKTNADFWKTKRDQTLARDQRNVQALEAAGWEVGIIWECQTKDIDALQRAVEQILPKRSS